MKKKNKMSIGRIICGTLVILGGLISVWIGIDRMLAGLPFILWVSVISFGVATTLGGIGVLLGMKVEDVTSFFP
ncbi:hypothetical protein [Streptomyces microflavus]|uniref:hypothetical protein n=1 Tax=Streptomyces microflavus TaxID=1919 RepID=UPI0036901DF9